MDQEKINYIKTNTSWNVSTHEIKALIKSLDKKAKMTNNCGIENWWVFMEISNSKIDDELANLGLQDKIVGKYMICAEDFLTDAKISFYDGVVYYRIILLDDEIIIYALNHLCNLLIKYNYYLTELKNITLVKKHNMTHYDEYILSFNDGFFIFPGINILNQLACNQLVDSLILTKKDELLSLSIEHNADYNVDSNESLDLSTTA